MDYLVVVVGWSSGSTGWIAESNRLRMVLGIVLGGFSVQCPPPQVARAEST